MFLFTAMSTHLISTLSLHDALPISGEPTIFVYDGAPGGAGFAERGAEDAAAWVRATADMIAECPCESGCPACVVSPKCGNGNEPLSKRWAEHLLGVLRPLEP